MGLAIFGILLNFFGVLATAGMLEEKGISEPAATVFLLITGGAAVLSLLGGILAGLGKGRLGGVLVIIGSIIFIPLGLVGIFGGRKLISAATNDLDARRELAQKNSVPNE